MTNLTESSVDNPGVNPEGGGEDESHLQRQLKAGERILTQVKHDKNMLQDANVRLDVELKDVHVQLADSVKENKRLRIKLSYPYIFGILVHRPGKPALSSPDVCVSRIESIKCLLIRDDTPLQR